MESGVTEDGHVRDDSAEDASWNLLSLTPKYEEEEHKFYVDALREVIDGDGHRDIRNIALSGSYGIGKSSILDGLGKVGDYQKRIITLSLPTLAPLNSDHLVKSHGELTGTTTNQIQQEIVKQLLYREAPAKMPATRFRRIEPMSWGRAAGISLILAIVVTILFAATGWMKNLEAATELFFDVGIWLPVWFFLVSLMVSGFVYFLTFGRLQITQLSTGPATVTLGDGATSYFDQYLDEILYFFQNHKNLNIVVFEDLDRFNDARIFETLRELNTLINASPKVRSRLEPVRFIYAARDSIFDHDNLSEQDRDSDKAIEGLRDPAQIEAVRANRTKFFDLVIPVVPFISHQSAGDLTRRVLKGVDYKDDTTPSLEGLLDLAVQAIPDMRLLTNIRNEFVVFKNRIFAGDGHKLQLADPQLFAMMIYKSTHLADFEAIRYQESNLDKLYEKQRELIRENTKSIQAEIRMLRDNLYSVRPDADWSTRAGEALIRHITRTARESMSSHTRLAFALGSDHYSEEDLRTTTFWSALVEASDDAVLDTTDPYTGCHLQFGRESIETAIGAKIDRHTWCKEGRERISSEIEKKQSELEFLKRADMGDLIKQEKFKVKSDDESLSLADIAKEILKSKGLAYNLVKAGYIDSNFTLYTSTFHGATFGPAATNFTIHHIKRNVMDEYFELSAEDVAALLKRTSDDAMREPAYYNINILDYLLKDDPDKADVMIRSLGSSKGEQIRLLQAYLDDGDQPDELIRRWTRVFEGVTSFLVEDAKLDDSVRPKLVSDSLSNFVDGLEYDEIDGYLKEHYAELDVLTSDSTTGARAKRITSWLEEGTFKVPELALLGTNVKSEVIDRGLFDITTENLEVIVEYQGDLALDTIKAVRPAAFNYLVSNLGEYLDAIQGLSPTVSRRSEYASVIGEVSDQADLKQVRRVIADASLECVIDELDDSPRSLWMSLAFENRVRPTFANIMALVLDCDATSDCTPLGSLLTKSQAIVEVQDADKDDKDSVALKLIEIPGDMLAARTVVSVIKSLDLQEPLADIPPEVDGEIFGLLLGAGQIEDSAELYGQLSQGKWTTRESYIENSKRFREYMTPELVGADLPEMISSSKISDEVKESVFDNIEAYLVASGYEGLFAIAEYAVAHDLEVPLSVVKQLASDGEPAGTVIPLLEPYLKALGGRDLFPLLADLGGNYAELTAVGQAKHTLADTKSNHALLDRLHDLGTVSSFSVKDGHIQAHMRRK